MNSSWAVLLWIKFAPAKKAGPIVLSYLLMNLIEWNERRVARAPITPSKKDWDEFHSTHSLNSFLPGQLKRRWGSTPRNHKNNQFVHSFSNWMILLVCSTARRSSLFLAGCLRLAAALNPPKKKDNWRALSFSARNETIHSSKTNFHFVFSSFIHSFSWAAEGRSKWKQTILPILKRRIDLFSCCWWPAAYLCFINSLQSSINQVLVWFRLTSVSSASIYLLL